MTPLRLFSKALSIFMPRRVRGHAGYRAAVSVKRPRRFVSLQAEKSPTGRFPSETYDLELRDRTAMTNNGLSDNCLSRPRVRKPYARLRPKRAPERRTGDADATVFAETIDGSRNRITGRNEKTVKTRRFHGFEVIPERFERSTHSLEGCCSIQLSYGTLAGRKRANTVLLPEERTGRYPSPDTVSVFSASDKGNGFIRDMQMIQAGAAPSEHPNERNGKRSLRPHPGEDKTNGIRYGSSFRPDASAETSARIRAEKPGTTIRRFFSAKHL